MPVLKPVKIKKLHIIGGSTGGKTLSSFKSITSTPAGGRSIKRKKSVKKIRNPTYHTTAMSKILESSLTRSYIPAL